MQTMNLSLDLNLDLEHVLFRNPFQGLQLLSRKRKGNKICRPDQRWKSAVPVSNTSYPIIFLLLFFSVSAQCFPVTADGNKYVDTFFCKNPGCAANVTTIFCNEDPVPISSIIKNCTGRPQPMVVCQHGGRAFASTQAGVCEFEGTAGFIETEKCKENTSICAFSSDTTSSEPGWTVDITVGSVIGVLVVGGASLVVLAFKCVQSKRRNRQSASCPDPAVAIPLTEQSSGNTSERNCSCAPGLDGAGPPLQCNTA
ncbi:uncharacterized protein LOC121184871 [Toxotes jaculatrix]|uniref:uncharacterized protein LOC121184871 n=1 Tax=Toxotes jaculatrix TaxID=941984 RepID=UPI001B3AD3DF|nr:uncharacterized protein LOC121184871 [Toxotes jaculatrix]